MGVVFVADFFTGGLLSSVFGYIPALTFAEPWRVLTVSFVHGSITHILFNGYSLWVLGNLVERKLGSGRFLAVFVLSSIAGSAAVFLINPGGFVVGASGAIFGLFAALFVVNRGFQGIQPRSWGGLSGEKKHRPRPVLGKCRKRSELQRLRLSLK
jgi:membrane associated rhomboid family serine protease